MLYTPQTTKECCKDCDKFSKCNGCYDGMEFSNQHTKEIIRIIEDKVQLGHLKSVSEILRCYENLDE